MDLLIVILCYLLGSLTFGIFVSRLHGEDIRARDLPGASGVFRQFGTRWGVLVVVLDLLKGTLAAFLASFGEAGWVMPLAAFAVVAGHNYPLYFGFRGGGGLLTSVGFFLYVYPLLTMTSVAFGLLLAALYYLLYWRRTRLGIYPIPFGAPFGYLFFLYSLRHDPLGLWAAVLVVLVVLARGVHILLARR